MERILKRNKLLQIVNNYIYDSLMPINLNILYQFGSILGIFLIIQIISGVLLTFYYIPHINYAFDSIDYITREVPYGWLIRTIHLNGAALFFLFVYLHIARALLYGSYTRYRLTTWTIGIIILFFMIITAFLGYSLVYAQMSYWAIAVITNLLTIIPKYGQEIVQYIYGGYNIGNATLNRFFSLHYLFPFIIVALTLSHLMTLHSVGGSNSLGINNISTYSFITFHPYYTFKDLLGFILAILLLLYFVFYHPYSLSHPDNFIPANPLVTPTHIIPEIYFLAYFAILRSIPNKTIGVLMLLFSILSLLFLPFLHKGLFHTSTFRPFSRYFIYSFFINFFLLTFIGESPVSEPFISLGQIFVFYHFFFLLFILPFLSFLESFLFLFIYHSKSKINLVTRVDLL